MAKSSMISSVDCYLNSRIHASRIKQASMVHTMKRSAGNLISFQKNHQPLTFCTQRSAHKDSQRPHGNLLRMWYQFILVQLVSRRRFSISAYLCSPFKHYGKERRIHTVISCIVYYLFYNVIAIPGFCRQSRMRITVLSVKYHFIRWYRTQS